MLKINCLELLGMLEKKIPAREKHLFYKMIHFSMQFSAVVNRFIVKSFYKWFKKNFFFRKMFKIAELVTLSHFDNDIYGCFGSTPIKPNYFACWVIVHTFVVVCKLLFSKLTFFQKFFQEHYQNVKRFGSKWGPTERRSWSGSKLFAKAISRR